MAFPHRNSSTSSSCNQKFRKVLTTLDYEPPVYCYCGLKAPLCTGKGSGRKFYGCQKFKDDLACGFIQWTDLDMHRDSSNSFEALKKIILEVKDDVRCTRMEIENMKMMLQNPATNIRHQKSGRWNIVIVVVVVLFGFLLSK